jgi:hypothetical protein
MILAHQVILGLFTAVKVTPCMLHLLLLLLLLPQAPHG